MEQRWSVAPDDGSVLLTGILQKTSLLRASLTSFAPRFMMLTPEYLYSFPQSYASDDPLPPLSRISLLGLIVANSSENPLGFSLLPAGIRDVTSDDGTATGGEERSGKVRFIAPDLDSKRLWVECLHKAISDTSVATASNNSMASGTRQSAAGVVDRSTKPVYEGALEKREDRFGSSYQTRWVEVRRDVGLLYGKFKSSPDASFKRISLLDKTIATNPDKLRFSIPADGDKKSTEIFFKCKTMEDYLTWMRAIEQEVHPARDAHGRRLTEREVADLRSSGDTYHNSSNNNNSTSAPLARVSPAAGVVDNDDDPFAAAKSPVCFPGIRAWKRGDHPEVVDHSNSGITADSSLLTNEDGSDATQMVDLGDETIFELEDLMSDIPLQYKDGIIARCSERTNLEPRLFDPNRLKKGVKVYLEAVCCVYDPKQDTPAFRESLNSILEQLVTYGLNGMVERLKDRMYSPFVEETYSALNEHIVLLDLDTQQLRTALTQLLHDHGKEEAVRPTVVALDDVLREYTCVRENLLTRRSIAAFRAQKDHCGLKLGVDGTIEFIRKLVAKDRGTPTEVNWRRIHQLYYNMYACLTEFRLEFDVFDVSRRTVEDMEEALMWASDWLSVNEPMMAWKSKEESSGA